MVADDSAEMVALPTSPYLMQPLRSLQQAQQDSQSAQRLPESGQVQHQEPQSSTSDDLAQPLEGSATPQKATW